MSSDQIIDGYVWRVGARLPGPSGARSDILDELHGGLLDAAAEYRSRGCNAAEAAATAVAEFGDVDELAAGFRGELAAAQARRVTRRLLATAIPVVLLWAYAAQASDGSLSHSRPWGWLEATPVPFALAAALIAAIAAMVTTIATGRPARRLTDRPRTAAMVAAVGGLGAAIVDLAIIALLACQAIVGHGNLSPVPVTAAAIASLSRLALAQRDAHQCLVARASLA
jgi:hypothetical protein